jgi:hypothetical protein
MQTKQKPKSDLPSDFDWTAHYALEDSPETALCGEDLLGIPASEDQPMCKECKRISDMWWVWA